MTKTKKTLTVGLAAALMMTTSMTAFAIPADGNRPDPVIVPESAPVVENLLPVLPGDEVGIVEADDFDDDEDEDGDDLADDDDDDDDDEDDVADDEDGEDEDDVADEDGEHEDDVADEDGDDEEDVADEGDEDGEDEEEDIAEGDDEDGDEEEVDVAEGEVNVPEFEGAVFEVVAKWDCENLYCGRLQVRDKYGNVIDTSEIHLDEEFVEDATPADMSFHHVHVGCRLRGYFAPVEGSDGVTRDGFYVQEFL